MHAKSFETDNIPTEISIQQRNCFKHFCLKYDCTGTYLVTSQYAEAVNDLLGSIRICALPCHEVQEGIEVHESGVVWINGGQDPLEVDFSLSVLADRVAQRY